MQDNGVKADPDTGSARAVGVLLILAGLVPDVVARVTGTAYVNRGHLRIPAARPDVVAQLVKLNPRASTGTQ
jgi:hypothetical protein